MLMENEKLSVKHEIGSAFMSPSSPLPGVYSGNTRAALFPFVAYLIILVNHHKWIKIVWIQKKTTPVTLLNCLPSVAHRFTFNKNYFPPIGPRTEQSDATTTITSSRNLFDRSINSNRYLRWKQDQKVKSRPVIKAIRAAIPLWLAHLIRFILTN